MTGGQLVGRTVGIFQDLRLCRITADIFHLMADMILTRGFRRGGHNHFQGPRQYIGAYLPGLAKVFTIYLEMRPVPGTDIYLVGLQDLRLRGVEGAMPEQHLQQFGNGQFP